jgi:hypothetical protein
VKVVRSALYLRSFIYQSASEITFSRNANTHPSLRAVEGRGNGRIRTADIAAPTNLHVPPLSTVLPVLGAKRRLGLLEYVPFLYRKSRHWSGASRIRTTARYIRR